MNRRSFITTTAVVPFTSPIRTDYVLRSTRPQLPSEDCCFWWGHVQHAIMIGDPEFCTEEYLDLVVKQSRLDYLSAEEAKQIIRLAFRREYTLSDIPKTFLRKPQLAMPEDKERFNRLLEQPGQ